MQKFKEFISSNRMMVLADQAVFSGTSFVTTILLARLLSPQSFGIYAGLILVIYLAVSFLNALIIQPMQVLFVKVEDSKSYESFLFWFQFFATAILASSILVVLKLLNSQIPIELPFLMFAFVFHDFLRKFFLATAKPTRALIIDVLSSLSQFCFLMVLLLNEKTSLGTVILGVSFTYLPGFFYSILFMDVLKLSASRWKEYMGNHWIHGKWLVLTAFVQWWSGNLFVVASGIYLGVTALGAFRLVQSLFGVLNVLLQTFENYFIPQTARLLNESKEEARKYLKKLNFKSATAFGLLLLLITLFAEQIITLAGGEEYSEFAFVVRGMALLYLFIFIGYPIRMAIRALLLNRQFFTGYSLSLVFSLISFRFLLEHFHLMGAIIGLIASQVILLLFWQLTLSKHNFSLWR